MIAFSGGKKADQSTNILLSATVTVNVTMNNEGQSQTDSQSNGQQATNMGRLLSMAVQEELHKQKRPGGILSPYGAAGGP